MTRPDRRTLRNEQRAETWWPFPALTPEQQAERREMERRAAEDELRSGLPSVWQQQDEGEPE